MTDVTLFRDAFGRLTMTDADGQTHVGVVPVHAFPISAPDSGIALMSPEGRELHWIESLNDAPPALQTLLREEFALRDFMPEISRINRVASFATPSAWHITTDRGEYSLILKSEDDIRRLPDKSLLITDSHGIHFIIRKPAALDKESRRLLDRFL